MTQHMAALSKANDFRLRRAQLGRELKTGDLRLSDFLEEEPPEWIEKEPIGRLVRRVPRFGARRMHRFLAKLEMRELTTLAELSEARRRQLARELRKVDR